MICNCARSNHQLEKQAPSHTGRTTFVVAFPGPIGRRQPWRAPPQTAQAIGAGVSAPRAVLRPSSPPCRLCKKSTVATFPTTEAPHHTDHSARLNRKLTPKQKLLLLKQHSTSIPARPPPPDPKAVKTFPFPSRTPPGGVGAAPFWSFPPPHCVGNFPYPLGDMLDCLFFFTS